MIDPREGRCAEIGGVSHYPMRIWNGNGCGFPVKGRYHQPNHLREDHMADEPDHDGDQEGVEQAADVHGEGQVRGLCYGRSSGLLFFFQAFPSRL